MFDYLSWKYLSSLRVFIVDIVTRVAAWKSVHWVQFLAPCWLLGMLLVVPCALRVAWIHFGGVLEVKWLPGGSILRVPGSIWAPFWLAFEWPRAPGHASGGSLCPRGGLDRFWSDFGSQKGAKMHLKIDKKSMKFGVRFLLKFGAPNGAKTEPWSFPKSTKI